MGKGGNYCMYANKQKRSGAFGEPKNRPCQLTKSQTNRMPINSLRIKQKNSRPSENRIRNFTGVFANQYAVIQKCNDSSEEEEKPYSDILRLYEEKNLGDTFSFETRISGMDEKDYYSVRYVLQNYPELLDDRCMYKTLGLIENCSITTATLESYDRDLFNYKETIISKLEESDNLYKNYTSFFKQGWFSDSVNVINRFFNVSIDDLNAIAEKGMSALKPLLLSEDAELFISKQSTLLNWFALDMVDDTASLGFITCNTLKDLFAPPNYPNIPRYALRVDKSKRLHFFERCKALSLGSYAIDEITSNPNKNVEGIENGPHILKMFDKNNHFSNWIHALAKLYEEKHVYLIAAKETLLPGKGLKTYETIITVISTADHTTIDTFVYHRHPDGIKQDIKNPNVTNKHLKPDRNSLASCGVDYSCIPAVIKEALHI